MTALALRPHDPGLRDITDRAVGERTHILKAQRRTCTKGFGLPAAVRLSYVWGLGLEAS